MDPSLREFFQTVASYNDMKNLSVTDRKHIENLRIQGGPFRNKSETFDF